MFTRLSVMLLVACAALAQQPREYPYVIRDRLAVAHEQLLPAPPGWGIPLVGVRNLPSQHLASLVFYSDALRPFSELSLPQTLINDAIAVGGDSGAPLLLLTAKRDTYSIRVVDARRGIGAGIPLDPGTYELTASKGQAVFSGVCMPSPRASDTLIVIAFTSYDQPTRHVIAAYTLRGTCAWQFLIGGASVNANVVNSAEQSILFSTSAILHESADTMHISARKAHTGMIGTNGALLWPRSFGGAGAEARAIPMPRIGMVACAVTHGDSSELALYDMKDGRERHFARLPGSASPQTLCISDTVISIVVAPDQMLQFDTTLHLVRRVSLGTETEVSTRVFALHGSDACYLLFGADRIALLDRECRQLGYIDSEMVRSDIGLERYSGVNIGNMFISSTHSGSSLRTIDTNTWWWWYRYRVRGGILAGIAVILLGATVAGRRFRFYRTYYNQLVRGSVATGVITLNRTMRVIHLNNAARELLGIAPYLPMQRHITEYMSGAAYADILQGVRDCMQTRITQEKIITIQTGSQPRTMLSRARPTLTRNGALAGCLLQLEDITRTIERERLMSWASVAHHVAHEMKTPIGTVLLNAQHLLKVEEDLPERARKYFHRIVTQAERLSGILQNFLSIARVSAMRFAQVDILAVMRNIAADYSELLPTHVSLAFEPGEIERTLLMIDEQQLTTALRNILDNALHAITPNIGTITITVEDHPMPPTGAIAIGVRDTGKGISDESRSRIFEPFFTETPGGSGIGMVIVKRIVDEHHGFIEVESTLGVGTIVRIVIPRSE